jgi:hypothetical protein
MTVGFLRRERLPLPIVNLAEPAQDGAVVGAACPGLHGRKLRVAPRGRAERAFLAAAALTAGSVDRDKAELHLARAVELDPKWASEVEHVRARFL